MINILPYSEDWDIELNRMLDEGNYTGTIIDNKLYYLESENYQVWVVNRHLVNYTAHIWGFDAAKINHEWRKKRPSQETREKLFKAADELELKLKAELSVQ